MTRDVPTGDPVQLAFLFHFEPRCDRASFVTSHSNFDALMALDRWPDWRHPVLALHGPPACGKSHLAAIWAAETQAERLETKELTADAPEPKPGGAYLLEVPKDRPPEERGLFHFLNRVAQAEASLLMVARVPPARWAVALPDLRTRLGAIPAVGVGPPDEGLVRAVLTKHLRDRQLALPGALVDFVVEQAGPSLGGLAALVEALEREIEHTHRAPTRAIIAAMMARLGAEDDAGS